jgi:exopolyphosphatase/pppGpp-phosphohydrolase
LQTLQRIWRTIQRYFQAFRGALRMTLRGETPPPLPYPELRLWIETGLSLVSDVLQNAEQEGFTHPERQAISFIADGRRITMETVLTSLRYHLAEEYPYLLRHLTEHSRLAIYSSNLNDEYRLIKLTEHLTETQSETLTETLLHLEALRNHLSQIPQTDNN